MYRYCLVLTRKSRGERGMVVAGLLSQLIAVVLLCFVRVDAMAQTALPSAPSEQQLLKPEALDQLLAPVALYPDTLLSKILVASTYPLEIVQADRWVKANTSLKGDA